MMRGRPRGRQPTPAVPLERPGTLQPCHPLFSVAGLACRADWLEDERTADVVAERDNASALWERGEGAATRLVGLTWVDGFHGVLALPGAGIATPAQLAGRRLALPRREAAGETIDVPRATARRGFHAATSLAGLFSDEVEYVDVPIPAAPNGFTAATAATAGITGAAATGAAATGAGAATAGAAATTASAAERAPFAAETAALLRGEVDAIHVVGPAGRALAARIGAVEVVDLGAHLDPMVRVNSATPIVLTADEQLLAERPQAVAAALAALLRAGAWAQRHPGEVTQAAAQMTGASPRAVVAAYGAGLHERLHVDLSAHKLAALRAQKDFLLTHGFLAGDVDLAAWVDPAPLAQARELLAA